MLKISYFKPLKYNGLIWSQPRQVPNPPRPCASGRVEQGWPQNLRNPPILASGGGIYASPFPLRGSGPGGFWKAVSGPLAPRPLTNRSKNPSCFRSVFGPVLEASWGPLGAPFGPSWAPKLAQVRSKRALGPRFFKKSDFSKFRAPLEGEHTLGPQAGPKMAQDRPKIVPRGLQEGLQEHLISRQILMSILDHFWVRFGTLWGHFWVPKSTPKSIKF